MKSCKKCGETKPLHLSIQATDALMVIVVRANSALLKPNAYLRKKMVLSPSHRQIG
jgi:hypothetical protein